MGKDKKLILLVIGVPVIIFLLFAVIPKRKPFVDMEPTYINKKTEPYGTYINFELLKDIFDGEIEVTRKPIYNNLSEKMNKYYDHTDSEKNYDEEKNDKPHETVLNDTSLFNLVDLQLTAMYDFVEIGKDTTAYVFVNLTFDMTEVDLEYLLDFVGVGNNVFISAESFSPILLDTLNIKARKSYFSSDSTFVLNDFSLKEYNMTTSSSNTTLNLKDCKLPVAILAENLNKQPVFIQVKYGKGYLYLHCLPSAFANITQIDLKKYDFAYRCLSYIPRSNIILWDEYQKQGLVAENSILRVMLSDPALRLSLYIIFFGFLVFMIFRAKRSQRIIPVINPPVNSSIEFLDTISNLYYRKKDFATIAEKRHAYFLDFVRKNYYMSTEHINDEFFSLLSSKSGFDKTNLRKMFMLYREIVSELSISNTTFLRYNKLLEEFYIHVRN